MIRIHHLSVRLPGFSLKEVDLSIEQGEFFCLLGPTGSGKTLILESIAGITATTGGQILVSGTDVTRLPPEKRGVGIVYQDCALFPHLSVLKNIHYGLRYHNGLNHSGRSRCDELIQRLELGPLLHRSVTTLSGGEKQRVALVRALATGPKVLLLDEPLAALDPCFREEIRDLLGSLHRDTGLTVLMVTHDFADAHSLAQRVAILHNGRIQQTGTVRSVFEKPATKMVAGFVGIKNVLPARAVNGTVTIGNMVFPLPGKNGKRRYAAIRPEKIHVQPAAAHARQGRGVPGRIAAVTNQGLITELAVDVSGLRIKSILLTGTFLEMNLKRDSEVTVFIDAGDIHLI